MTHEMTKELRASLVRAVAEAEVAKRDADGWDQPHHLCFVTMTELSREGSQVTGLQTLIDFPIPLGALPGDAPYEKLESLAGALYAMRRMQGPVPEVPEGLVGLAFLAESWAVIGDQSMKPPHDGGLMPSEHPDRREALVVTFVDLKGHLTSAMHLRGGTEATVYDLDDFEEEHRVKTLEHSRMYPPLLIMGLLFGGVPLSGNSGDGLDGLKDLFSPN